MLFVLLSGDFFVTPIYLGKLAELPNKHVICFAGKVGFEFVAMGCDRIVQKCEVSIVDGDTRCMSHFYCRSGEFLYTR